LGVFWFVEVRLGGVRFAELGTRFGTRALISPRCPTEPDAWAARWVGASNSGGDESVARRVGPDWLRKTTEDERDEAHRLALEIDREALAAPC
jgi:hypothetical protein